MDALQNGDTAGLIVRRRHHVPDDDSGGPRTGQVDKNPIDGTLGDAEHKSARCLRIAKEAFPFQGRYAPINEAGDEFEVAFGSAGHETLQHEFLCSGHYGYGCAVQRQADPAADGQFVQMPEEAESSHIGTATNMGPLGGSGGSRVERGHCRHSGSVRLSQRSPGGNSRRWRTLEGGSDDSGSEGLGHDKDIADSGGGVRHHPVGMNFTGYRLTEERLRSINGVSTDDDPSAAGGNFGGPGESLTEQIKGKQISRPSGDVQSKKGCSAHGVHIGSRVGSGNHSPRAGVVDDRGKKIYGGNQGAFRREPPNGSVITTRCSDEKVRGGRGRHMAQHVRQLGRSELAGSTGAVAVSAEPYLVGKGLIELIRHFPVILTAERFTAAPSPQPLRRLLAHVAAVSTQRGRGKGQVNYRSSVGMVRGGGGAAVGPSRIGSDGQAESGAR